MPAPSVPYIVRRPVPLHLAGRAYCPGSSPLDDCRKSPEWTVMQHLLSAVSSLGNAIMHCLYPAAIIVCLVRPGLIQYAPPPGAAFQVLPPAAGANPVQS